MSETIEELKARAAALNTSYVKETVHIDIATYEKVISFIEAEGCNLREGLRRAVRMGVEALLLERTPSEIAPSYEGPYVPPAIPGYYIGQSSYSKEELDIDAANASGVPSDGDFTRIAPPGL